MGKTKFNLFSDIVVLNVLLFLNLDHLGLCLQPKNPVAIIKTRIIVPINHTRPLGVLYDP